MGKIILYYKFIPVEDPQALMQQQRNLCSDLNLKGRILISKHGINGTLGGNKLNLKKYINSNEESKLLKNVAYKWSDGAKDVFPKLSIKVRDEIITFDATDKIKVTKKGVVGAGKHIEAEALHKLIEEKGDEVVFFDGRNNYESAIGRFKGAVLPNINKTKEFLDEIKSFKYDYLKNKTIVTYCTGGIRCEVLSTLLINNGFKNVYQLSGGIVNYCEKFGDSGLWEGSLYVFDRRMTINYSKQTKKLGTCVFCKLKTNRYINCANKPCNLLFLCCNDCSANEFCINEPKSATIKVKLNLNTI
ncbi:MAG TPA: rhodanese-related sulfurtransferase [Candidatus Saccharimonadia bacterium]|nr:rhodanese-related sulfurtransferase [Candidatus Saccharimonadia bacterium]